MLSDTLAANGPNDVPTIRRVSGITTIIKITNGNERIKLTSVPRMRCTGRLAKICPYAVV